LGWSVGSRASADVCPTCVEARRKPAPRNRFKPSAPPVTPIVIAAAPPAPVQLQPEEAMNDTAQDVRQAIVADPPRQPTLADRRRVLDAIDMRWNHDMACYAKDHSDDVVATFCNVPRAWVKSIREDFFGAETNEALAETVAKLDVIIARADVLEANSFKLAEEADELRKAARAAKLAVGKAA
jgi:hypothetical protein